MFANFGVSHYCPVCSNYLRSFLPHGSPPEPNFLCPVCGTKPPHRLARLYVDTHPELFRRGGLFVHLAPEPELRVVLEAKCRAAGMIYRCGGLGGIGEGNLDLRALNLPDGSVDAIYCCHVLNAMEDDLIGMREIRRVLKETGYALLQVPAFCQAATTLEGRDVNQRIQFFADPLIFRFYTDADYQARLRDARFQIEVHRARDYDDAAVERMQLKSELLHVCTPLGRQQ